MLTSTPHRSASVRRRGAVGDALPPTRLVETPNRRIPSTSRLGRWLLALEAADEPMDVAENPQITNQLALEGEDRRTVPPHMPPGGLNAEELAPMAAVKAELAKDFGCNEGSGSRLPSIPGA